MPRNTTAGASAGAAGVSIISTTGGDPPNGPRKRPGPGRRYTASPRTGVNYLLRAVASSRSGRNRHRAGDDRSLCSLDLRLVRVERRVGRRVAHAVLSQAETSGAGLELARDVVGDER